MAEPVSVASAAIKSGTMVATGGLMAELIIFNDSFYMYLALVGALVSMFGVLHEVLKNRPITHTATQIGVEIIKGLALGVMAIPFWYLILSTSGETIIVKFIDVYVGGVENSVWLMISFSMSWYTVPIYDWIVSKVQRKAKDV